MMKNLSDDRDFCEKEKKFIDKIENHTLGNKEEAFSLYFKFCDLLKEKYGEVDRDYDNGPTRRGKEWLDIHHILEYELKDIARLTANAFYIKRREKEYSPDCKFITVDPETFDDPDKMDKIRKSYEQCHYKEFEICAIAHSLEELKPYNFREKLVYANKIEHFLLHYLIGSIFGQSLFAGGPNGLWDVSVALDLYGFDADFMNRLQNEKEKYYSLISSVELTLIYKKLIDWKNSPIDECARYWLSFSSVMRRLSEKGVSYVKDKEKFFRLMDILQYDIGKENKDRINNLPFKVRKYQYLMNICYNDLPMFIIDEVEGIMVNDNILSPDGKTLIQVITRNRNLSKKNIRVPEGIEVIKDTAFLRATSVEALKIPLSVKKIDDNTFKKYLQRIGKYNEFKKIYYEGTDKMWQENFKNVDLCGLSVVCKKEKC